MNVNPAPSGAVVSLRRVSGDQSFVVATAKTSSTGAFKITTPLATKGSYELTTPQISQVELPTLSPTFGDILAPGATAYATLSIEDPGVYSPSACHQVTAHWLRIYPPDQFSSLYTSFTTPVCSAKITGGSTPLMILPVRPGLAVAQTVP